MLISYNWLQKYFNEKLPSPEDIAQGIIFHSFEIESVEKVDDDTVFDIKILPDRAHDCLSHWGIAKEVSAIFNLALSLQPKNFRQSGNASELKIDVKNPTCRRYMGRIVKGVKVGPSPLWLKNLLVAIGQKSINNIVDATNFVMFDLGNPIHAFDLDKLASSKIIVESAKEGEKFVLLDGKEVTLDQTILTIRDEKDALAVAGVKGGKKAEIDVNTKNIVIEVANFDPVSTRKAAKKLGIFTDSAKRFENEIPPLLASIVMQKITELIIELAGGEVCEVVDVYNGKEEERKISFTESYLNNLLGIKIPKESINDILNRFGYEFKNDGENYEVKVLPLRLDMHGPSDMAEEIGRIYGYEKITPVLPKIPFDIKENSTWNKINSARAYFLNEGYREVMNYAFTNKGDVEVLASASDKNFLRNNLTDGLKESIKLNILNSPLLDMKEVKVFEIGTIFLKDKEEIHVAYGGQKNVTEVTLDEFIKVVPQELGNFSAPSIETPTSQSFKPWSVYPFITRDIAVWVPAGEDSEKLRKILVEEGTNLLIKEPYLFDSFTKGERTSYAYRLVFQSYEKTLKDEEISEIMQKIAKKIANLGWEIR